MPDVQTFEPDRAQLVRYLMDLLPEDEAERLDLASIVDDDVASRLCLVESDLVDDYVTGTLTGATLEQFETHYLSSSRRRDNVKLAARFLSAVERVAADTDTRARAARVRGAWRLAAAVLVIAAGGAFVLQIEQRGLQRQPVARPPASTTVVEAPKNSLPARVEPSPRTPAAPHALGVAALVLWPQTRSAGPLPTLLIRPGRATAMLELTLESNAFAEYRAGLKNPSDHEVVWTSDWITPTVSGSRTILRIAVPVSKLRSRHYSIEVSGHSPDGTAEIVESYAFRVGSR
jgi:hypothetical protein